MHDVASVQLLLRRFTAATNLSIPGRTFAVPTEQTLLRATLKAMGARVVPAETAPAAASVVVAAQPVPGLITVTNQHVFAPDGTVLQRPEHTDAAERIEWAAAHMPLTAAPIAGVRGLRIGLALVVEPKTAVLALRLAEAGAEVHVFGHADEIRPAVLAHLQAAGIRTYPDRHHPGGRPSRPTAVAREFLSQRLHLLLDDGSHLIRWAHQVPGALDDMLGAAEETTSGLASLRAWQRHQELRVPVIAVNDARSKTLFDNAYGTGQSCLMTILDLLDPTEQGWPLWRSRVVVAGYGDVGKGFAKLAAALGAEVAVAELDPVRAGQARMDGHLTGELTDLVATADLVVSATGVRDTISLPVLLATRPGAAVAVAGGVDQEIALADAEAAGATWSPAGRLLADLRLPVGGSVRVLDEGGCINCTAGEGNPIEIMDLSYAVQLAAIDQLLAATQPPGLSTLPKSVDDQVAAALAHYHRPQPQATPKSPQAEPVRVFSAGLVIPITSPPFLDGAVAVRGERILHVGDREWVLRTLQDAETTVTETRWPGVLLPGLVNAHTHLQYTSMAKLGRGEYQGFDDWAAAFNQIYDHAVLDWAAAAADGAAQCLRHGVTAVADVVTDIVAASALHDAGLHGVAYWEVMDWSAAQWAARGQTEVLAALAAMPATPAVGLSPHAPYSLDAAPLLDIPDLARHRGLRLHIHLGESQLEAEWVHGRSSGLADLWRSEVATSFSSLRAGGVGVSATQFVDQLGVLGPDCHVAHGVYLTAEDRRRLRVRGSAVALCPRSNRVVGLAPPPVADYLREGNLIAVGTDSLSSSPSLDVLADLAELAKLARQQGYHEPDLYGRLLRAATLGGAMALGLGVGRDRVGQLQAGAVADMTFLDIEVSDVAETIEAVVRHGAGTQAATMVSGQLRWHSPAFPS